MKALARFSKLLTVAFVAVGLILSAGIWNDAQAAP